MLDRKQLFNGIAGNSILYSYLMGVDARPNYLSFGAGNDQVFYCMRLNTCWPHAIEHLVIPSTEGQIVWSIASTPIK
jgi:hypothetical protein